MTQEDEQYDLQMMELDVHLTREGAEPWGFQLIGGNDCGVPLTVDEVDPASPAFRAGLQQGDTVARLCDKLACDLSHDAAVALVANAIGSLPVGICRGLYDPVLDDFEPIDQERPDSDPRSVTEVTENEITLDTLNDYLDSGLINDEYLTDLTLNDRAMTESPFLPNTKPYRPFSTEPLEVPPVENPIILNPDYKDGFGDVEKTEVKIDPEDDLLKLLPLDKNIEAKFKLPVSEKYDPNWGKRVDDMLTKIEKGEFLIEQVNNVSKEVTEYSKFDSKEVKNEIQSVTKEVTTENEFTKTTKEVNNVRTKEVKESDVKQVQFDEEMRKEIDITKIEQTALEIVDESIERAVSVTREIKKEIEREMKGEMHEEYQIEKKETNEIAEFVHKESNTSQKIEELNIVNEEFNENITQDKKFVEKKMSRKKEMEQVDVETKSIIYEEDANMESVKNVSHKKLESNVSVKSFDQKTDERKEFSRNFETKRDVKSDYETHEGKQKAFMIGLQTIPHIKGFVQSSHHFDLLLRTFFVHLTDVMVALSRFILTQPASELDGTAEKVINEKLIKDLSTERREEIVKQESYKSQVDVKHREATDVKHSEVKVSQLTQNKQQNKTVVENQTENNIKLESNQIENRTGYKEEERKRRSGAEMALMSERKSTELAKKMGAVITEFETKTGKETLEVTERRSKRSQIEEEVLQETDPLEWLDKVDRKEERTDSIVNKESFTESKKQSRHKSSKDKQTYVAIVESHVYTNYDAILEDQALEISETASIQSSEDIQTALESLEAVSTESVAINNVVEKKQAVEIISEALEEVIQEKQQILESVANIEEISINNKIDETQAVKYVESFKTAAVEFEEIALEATKDVTVEISKQETAKQEVLANIAVESTEVITDSKVESFESQEISAKHETAKQEVLANIAVESTDITTDYNVKTFESEEILTKNAVMTSEDTLETAINVSEVALETAKEVSEISFVQMENAVLTSEETLKTAVKSEVTLETAKEVAVKMETEEVSIEQTDVKTAINLSEVTMETAKEVSVSEISTETELSVAKTNNKYTKTDENASLKITKHEIVDQQSEEIRIQSEEYIKKSVEINLEHESSKLSQVTKLHLQTDLANNDENNNTPSPSTVPPTPLTDEYVFQLTIPLPKTTPLPITPLEDPPEETSEHEDLNIVKKKLVPHIETKIEEPIIYDPPLPTPEEGKPLPVYTKPGLKGGSEFFIKKEYIREIERKSSLLASAIDETIKSIEEYKEEIASEKKEVSQEKMTNGFANIENGDSENVANGETNEENALPCFKSVVFNPEAFQANLYQEVIRGTNDIAKQEHKVYVDERGEPLGTIQGIVDGLEDAVVDQEVAKELGKPGITEDKIAELISGESEMLREAHVMGLSRVLTSHMNRPDDSSVDFQKIKPLVDSLKDSEVIKVLNEEIQKEKEKQKKEEQKKWTTFLQKPKRAVPRAKFGYHGYVEPEPVVSDEPYKVKIVKQPKPKVAPDYKPEDFDTGPLPWEERALNEPPPPEIPPEEPILVPEDCAEFLEAVDPLPESEVPDLEDTGIPLPTRRLESPEREEPELPQSQPEVPVEETTPIEEPAKEEPEVPQPTNGDMDQNKMAEQLVNSVKSMVDPNASLEQQLAQMRAQLSALAQLPNVIQHSLEMLTRQLTSLTHKESHHVTFDQQVQIQEVQENTQSIQEYHETYQNDQEETQNNQEDTQNNQEDAQNGVTIEEIQSPKEEMKLTAEEYEALKREEEAVLEEQRKCEKMKKEQARIDQESRQVKQRAPRVGKPQKMFGPLEPEARPLVLPGGRRWRGPKDAFNDQMIAETLQSQAEIIQGKVLGYESDRLPYDERINFMKYEKPPVSLDHLQNSEVYKMIHDIEQVPTKRVELLTPVVAESDYRERCRSVTPRINANGLP